MTLYPPSDEARLAGLPVARLVESPVPGSVPEGFGTGFLVSPRLLLTNHHVFSSREEARGVCANFLHEYRDGRLQQGLLFDLDPDAFFYANEALDFALVGVSSTSSAGHRTDAIGATRLIDATGKILLGHPINIVQHPDGGPKRYATSENKLLDILDVEGVLHYSTDTLEGSSGSPAFNSAWELVALHHAGVPLVINGNVMTEGGDVWRTGMPESEVQWVANEGVRVSAILANLRSTTLPDGRQHALLRSLLSGTGDPLGAVERWNPADTRRPVTVSGDGGHANATGVGMGAIVFNVNGNSTVNITVAAGAVPAGGGEGTPVTSSVGPAALALPLAPSPRFAEARLRFDPRYKSRKGYQADFLGVEVPLPTVVSSRTREMLMDGAKPRELRYHHFTLAMNKTRRLQMWSAANVSYDPRDRRFTLTRDEYGDDTWTLDERIDAEDQIVDAEFYQPAKRIDRGHIVRREDSAWGRTALEAEYANADTFHWTNCTPQHEAFNQARRFGLWGRFEEHIENEIGVVGHKMSIFAGPVLDNTNDPTHDFGLGTIQYPLRFWKVIAARVEDEGLMAWGFMFDQSGPLDRTGLGLESIDFRRFRTYARSLAHISRQTGVEFPSELTEADVKDDDAPEPVDSFESIRRHRAKKRANGAGPPASK